MLSALGASGPILKCDAPTDAARRDELSSVTNAKIRVGVGGEIGKNPNFGGNFRKFARGALTETGGQDGFFDVSSGCVR